MSGFLRGLQRQRTNPHERHEFKVPDTSRMAIAAGSTQPSEANIGSIAMANASMRALTCGVPGCGKTRDDPIHEPDEPGEAGEADS